MSGKLVWSSPKMMCRYITTLFTGAFNTDCLALQSIPDSFWPQCAVVCGHSWQLHVVTHPYPAAAVQHSGDHSDLQHAVVSPHSEIVSN